MKFPAQNAKLPMISFIIPAHNEEKYISRTLKSIFNFTSMEDFLFEVLVINVGSTDGTKSTAAQFPVQIFDIKKSSPGFARNFGVKQSTGDLLVFLDGDVAITRVWVKKFAEIVSVPEILRKSVIGAPYIIRPDASWIEKTWFSSNVLKGAKYINAGNLIVKKDIFEKLTGFDTNLPTGEDYDFCLRAKKQGFDIVIDEKFEAIHYGYPNTLVQFFIRESWHGSGDAISLSQLIKSKVAMYSVAYTTAIAITLILLVFKEYSLSITTLTASFLFPLFFSFKRASKISSFPVKILKTIKAIPLASLYLLGRSFSIFMPQQLVVSLRSKYK